MVLELRIKRITTDSGLVLGSYDPDLDVYRSVDKPSALTHFVKTCVYDLFRPRANHTCTPACAEVVTICIGAPFQANLSAAAPT